MNEQTKSNELASQNFTSWLAEWNQNCECADELPLCCLTFRFLWASVCALMRGSGTDRLGPRLPIPANSRSPGVQGDQLRPRFGGGFRATPPERPTGGAPKAHEIDPLFSWHSKMARTVPHHQAPRGAGRASNINSGTPPKRSHYSPRRSPRCQAWLHAIAVMT